jgi:integrase
MPKKAGVKLCTPLIERYSLWLNEDVQRSSRTCRAYGDSVEFFAATRPDAADIESTRLPSAASCQSEERFSTNSELDWAAVTLSDIEAFVRRPLQQDGAEPSKSTRRRRIYALKAFFEFLEDHEEIGRNPTRKLRGPGVKVGKPKPIPDHIWLLMWDRDMTPEDRVLLGLGYYMGFRRHEIVGVGPHHFDLERRRVANFPRKGGKTNDVVYGGNLDIIARHPKTKHLGVRLDEFEEALAKVVAWRSGDERLLGLTEHVAVDNQSDSTINRKVSSLAARAGAPHVTPHQLRHSFGTNLLRADVPAIVVADQMAHSSMETTRGYLDTTQWYEEQQTGTND